MLFDQVLYSFISVLYLFLTCADLLRSRPLGIGIVVAIGHLLLLEALLIHLINEEVNIFTHLLKLVSQLLVLSFQVLLLLGIFSQSLDELGSVSHLFKLTTGFLESLFNEFVRVPILHNFLMVH